VLSLFSQQAIPQIQSTDEASRKFISNLPSNIKSGAINSTEIKAATTNLISKTQDAKLNKELQKINQVSDAALKLEECLEQKNILKADEAVKGFYTGILSRPDPCVDLLIKPQGSAEELADDIQDIFQNLSKVKVNQKDASLKNTNFNEMASELHFLHQSGLISTYVGIKAQYGEDDLPLGDPKRYIDFFLKKDSGSAEISQKTIESTLALKNDPQFLKVLKDVDSAFTGAFNDKDQQTVRKKVTDDLYQKTRKQLADFYKLKDDEQKKQNKAAELVNFISTLPEISRQDLKNKPAALPKSTTTGKTEPKAVSLLPENKVEVDKFYSLLRNYTEGEAPKGWQSLSSHQYPEKDVPANFFKAKQYLTTITAFNKDSDKIKSLLDHYEKSHIEPLVEMKVQKDVQLYEMRDNPIIRGALGTHKNNNVSSVGLDQALFLAPMGINIEGDADGLFSELGKSPKQSDDGFKSYLNVYTDSIKNLFNQVEEWKKDLSPEDFIKNLLYTNPALAGSYLAKHPEQAPQICFLLIQATEEKEKDQKNKEFWKKVGTWSAIAVAAVVIVASAGTGIAAVAGVGSIAGVSLATATTATTAVGLIAGVGTGVAAFNEGVNLKAQYDYANTRLVALDIGDPKEVSELLKNSRAKYWEAAAELGFSAADLAPLIKSLDEVTSLKQLRKIANSSRGEILAQLKKAHQSGTDLEKVGLELANFTGPKVDKAIDAVVNQSHLLVQQKNKLLDTRKSLIQAKKSTTAIDQDLSALTKKIIGRQNEIAEIRTNRALKDLIDNDQIESIEVIDSTNDLNNDIWEGAPPPYSEGQSAYRIKLKKNTSLCRSGTNVGSGSFYIPCKTKNYTSGLQLADDLALDSPMAPFVTRIEFKAGDEFIVGGVQPHYNAIGEAADQYKGSYRPLGKGGEVQFYRPGTRAQPKTLKPFNNPPIEASQIKQYIQTLENPELRQLQASARELAPVEQLSKINETKTLRDLSSDEKFVKEANVLIEELTERAGIKMREIPINIRPARVPKPSIDAAQVAKVLEDEIRVLQTDVIRGAKSSDEFVKSANAIKTKAVELGNTDAAFQVDFLIERHLRFQDLVDKK
jgi:hypothetical protein